MKTRRSLIKTLAALVPVAAASRVMAAPTAIGDAAIHSPTNRRRHFMDDRDHAASEAICRHVFREVRSVPREQIVVTEGSPARSSDPWIRIRPRCSPGRSSVEVQVYTPRDLGVAKSDEIAREMRHVFDDVQILTGPSDSPVTVEFGPLAMRSGGTDGYINRLALEVPYTVHDA